jgi:hypothetical protein
MDAVRLRQLVCHLPRSGMFFRRDAYQGRCRVVGICTDGDYATLTLDGATYLAHRAYMEFNASIGRVAV